MTDPRIACCAPCCSLHARRPWCGQGASGGGPDPRELPSGPHQGEMQVSVPCCPSSMRTLCLTFIRHAYLGACDLPLPWLVYRYHYGLGPYQAGILLHLITDSQAYCRGCSSSFFSSPSSCNLPGRLLTNPFSLTQAIWLSASADLAADAERDLRDAGALRYDEVRIHDLDAHDLERVKAHVFTPYTPMVTLFTPRRYASMTSSGSRPSRRSACPPKTASREQTQACYSGACVKWGGGPVSPSVS